MPLSRSSHALWKPNTFSGIVVIPPCETIHRCIDVNIPLVASSRPSTVPTMKTHPFALSPTSVGSNSRAQRPDTTTPPWITFFSSSISSNFLNWISSDRIFFLRPWRKIISTRANTIRKHIHCVRSFVSWKSLKWSRVIRENTNGCFSMAQWSKSKSTGNAISIEAWSTASLSMNSVAWTSNPTKRTRTNPVRTFSFRSISSSRTINNYIVFTRASTIYELSSRSRAKPVGSICFKPRRASVRFSVLWAQGRLFAIFWEHSLRTFDVSNMRIDWCSSMTTSIRSMHSDDSSSIRGSLHGALDLFFSFFSILFKIYTPRQRHEQGQR